MDSNRPASRQEAARSAAPVTTLAFSTAFAGLLGLAGLVSLFRDPAHPPGTDAAIETRGPTRTETTRLEIARQEARDGLRAAAEFKAVYRGARGPHRDAARHRAIEAYQGVYLSPSPGLEPVADHEPNTSRERTDVDDNPEMNLLRSEAAFRAGELFRASGRPSEALGAFRAARSWGPAEPFGDRAVLEIAHIHRRAGRWNEALDEYFALMIDSSSERGRGDDAAYWAGRVYEELGRGTDAERLWWPCARDSVDPVDRVRAYDRLILARIESGDLEGAAGLLARCREELAERAAERTRYGRRVKSALERMRCTPRLARAVRTRTTMPAPPPLSRRRSREQFDGFIGPKKIREF